jgi:hypothetical protein
MTHLRRGKKEWTIGLPQAPLGVVTFRTAQLHRNMAFRREH